MTTWRFIGLGQGADDAVAAEVSHVGAATMLTSTAPPTAVDACDVYA